MSPHLTPPFTHNYVGMTNYGMGLTKCIILTILTFGFALFVSYFATLGLGFLICCDASKSHVRIQLHLVLPILFLVLIPGKLWMNYSQSQLEIYDQYDYRGDMAVMGCFGHYHERTIRTEGHLSREAKRRISVGSICQGFQHGWQRENIRAQPLF